MASRQVGRLAAPLQRPCSGLLHADREIHHTESMDARETGAGQKEEAELSGGTDQGFESRGGSGCQASLVGRVFDVAAVDAAARFCGIMRMVDAQTRRAGRGELLSEEAQRVEEEFLRLVDVLGAELNASRLNPIVRQRVRALLEPWLRKSRFWGRALFKSRGPGSDFQLLEWVYDLEGESVHAPAESGVTTVLDEVFAMTRPHGGGNTAAGG